MKNLRASNKSWLSKNKWIVRTIGLAIFAYIIIFQIDVKKSLAILTDLKAGYLILSLLLVVPAILVKSIRWWTLLRNQKIPLSLREALALYTIGLFGGFVTPGQLGDFIKVYYLRKGGQSVVKSFTCVLFDRLFDVLVFVLFGFAGVLVFMDLLAGRAILIGVVGAVAALILAFIHKQKILSIISRIYTYYVPGKIKESTKTHLDDFLVVSKEVFRRKLFKILFGYSFLGMVIYLIRVYFLALSLKISISIPYFFACISVVSLICLIPISIADVGTRDGALIFMFSKLGIEKEYALSLSLLILLLAILNGTIGFLVWLRHPLHVRSEAPSYKYKFEKFPEKV